MDNRARQRMQRENLNRRANAEARARGLSGGQMRQDRQRTQPTQGPIVGATSQAYQAMPAGPTGQMKRPSLGQMATGMAMNRGMEEVERRIFPRTSEPMGSLPGSTAATASMENLVTPSRVARTAATENIGAQTGLLKGAEAAVQPGFMSMLSGLGSQMGPLMAQYGMPLLGAYALSRMLASGGYVGPLSKKG